MSYLVFHDFNPSAVGDGKKNFPLLVFSRFLDKDRDGIITIDDISTMQAMILQKSDVFVRLIFRMYSEALWYPGKQINIMKIQGSSGVLPSSPGNQQSTGGNLTLANDRSQSAGLPQDFVEPPKFITDRHVAAVFEKLGYDSHCGTKVFGVLCEALSRIDDCQEDVGGVGGDLDNEDGIRHSNSNSPTHNKKIPSKMDVQAFIRVVQIDDVLLQAVSRRPRSTMRGILENARKVSKESDGAKSVADVLEQEILSILVDPGIKAKKKSAFSLI